MLLFFSIDITTEEKYWKESMVEGLCTSLDLWQRDGNHSVYLSPKTLNQNLPVRVDVPVLSVLRQHLLITFITVIIIHNIILLEPLLLHISKILQRWRSIFL